MIPYVISEAHPDYKRPYVLQDFGMVKEEEIQTYFLDRICDFILDRVDENDITCENSISTFFNSYYDEYYMDNSPWEAMVFVDGDWQNVTPYVEKIWEHIQLLKNQEKVDKKEEVEKQEVEKQEEGDEDNQSNFELSEADKNVLTQMKNFFEQMLKEKPLPPSQIENLQRMTEVEQLSLLFNIYMTQENYTQNKDMYCGFLNLLVKFVQIEIERITKEMETEHSEELSKKLEYALAVYTNTMFIKQTFNF